jgi:pseudouridine-5'-phosphate glycosidase
VPGERRAVRLKCIKSAAVAGNRPGIYLAAVITTALGDAQFPRAAPADIRPKDDFPAGKLTLGTFRKNGASAHMGQNWYIDDAVQAALQRGKPVVALESAFLTHGLPRLANLETARAMLAAVRQSDAVPAMLAVIRGCIHVGLSEELLENLARGESVRKCSARDLSACLVRGETAGLTVAASLMIAEQVGIRVLATGGIGGVHRGQADFFDVSADLVALSRHAVAVLCSGAKSLMDTRATLEALETLGVPVFSWGTSIWPAFLLADSGVESPNSCHDLSELARIIRQHWQLGGKGVVLAVPPPQSLSWEEHETALRQALKESASARLGGPQLTPFILRRLAELTQGRSLAVNRALLIENACLAARLARELTRLS